ncbi:uncharacterized protein LOC135143658 isoform X2 [Zophobas morio]|uniref:uncharacterized protein LOC135143658 isoform X2 n=1 Tax=Zophobas morio TaxID=2755281 RepID=UPI003082D7E5
MVKFKHAIFFMAGICIVLLVYLNNYLKSVQMKVFRNEEPNINSSKYLVDTSKCKILDVDPFDRQVKAYHKKIAYYPCTHKELLTYVTKDNNVTTLHINTKAFPQYQVERATCCSREVRRRMNAYNPDRYFMVSKPKCFRNNVTLGTKPVMVSCRMSKQSIYENVHAPVTITEKVKEKLEVVEYRKLFSVLLIGIDSVSRLNFIRSLPNSYKFLMDNNWISFIGYNKIDDNTYPNIMAILTGNKQKNFSNKCDTDSASGLNKCYMLWDDFSEVGYVTAYAEDEVSLSTFNLDKMGFQHSPTDYYFRPYFLASSTLTKFSYEGLEYCTGPESTGERVLNVAKDFATTFVDYPSFGLFWMNSFSHNTLNMVSMMDDKIRQFLQDITNNGVLENSFVIFLSDHGLRCTDFRYSSMGWLEERLPFFFMWVPRRFRKQFPNEYLNLQRNTAKLTNPYDLFMTLQHLLVLSDVAYIEKPSVDCPKCSSLFTKMANERSCQDAGIAQHWCTCLEYTPVNRNARKAGHKCARFLLHKVIASSISKQTLLIVIETRPKAAFEATLFFKGENASHFDHVDGISRIDIYKEHSWCVSGYTLPKFCYCK